MISKVMGERKPRKGLEVSCLDKFEGSRPLINKVENMLENLFIRTEHSSCPYSDYYYEYKTYTGHKNTIII